MEREFFVLHSPSMDGLWRGIDQCLCAPMGGPMLFESAEAADAFVRDCGLKGNYYVAVKVGLTSPAVGGRL
jgi:hypothetical protein